MFIGTQQGLVQHNKAWSNTTRTGPTQQGLAQHNKDWPNTTRLGRTQQGLVERDKACGHRRDGLLYGRTELTFRGFAVAFTLQQKTVSETNCAQADTGESKAMKAVILAGGLGTRLAEETELRPKPLVEIGGYPILWHVMKIYETAGLTDFVICGGYKVSMIKRYFANYYLDANDVEIDLANGAVRYLDSPPREKWKVIIADTGLDTMTGGRLKRIAALLGNEAFCLTYGDGVADLDVRKVIEFHRRHGRLATITAVPSPGRFGILDIAGDARVSRFHEKPDGEMGWINGGFFVLEPGAIDYIEGDSTMWERQPLERLAQDGQLVAYRHTGFWRPMDTLRDKHELEALWRSPAPPWKIW
jgi:glucose-1-phosphate cytidylyltransferase